MGAQTLRWATAEDIPSISPLIEEYHRQEGLRRHSKDRVQQVLEDLFEHPQRGKILLAVDEADQSTLAYALVVRRPSFEYAAEVAVLDEIFVKGKVRERGLGRRMVSFVEDYAASEGLPAITLEVSTHNVSAREFYRSVGFHRVDREIYARPVGGPR